MGASTRRWRGRYPAAAAVFRVEIQYNHQPCACHLSVQEHADRYPWACCAHGAYPLRTHYVKGAESALWKWHIQLKQAEAAFRCCSRSTRFDPWVWFCPRKKPAQSV